MIRSCMRRLYAWACTYWLELAITISLIAIIITATSEPRPLY